MDLIKLKTFSTVARLGSFSRTAETLYFSQPAISAQIKDLEYEYGEKLFNREGRKIELTKAGEVLLGYVDSMMKLYDESKYAVNFIKEKEKGVIHMGVSTFPGTHFLPSLMSQYKKKYPKTSFSLSVNNAKKIREMVLKKELEFGIIGSIDTLSSDSNLIEEVLIEDEVVLAVDNDHPLADREFIKISDLESLECISTFKNTVSRQVIRKLFYKHGIERNVSFEIENKGMTKAMVQNGLGAAFFAQSEVKQEAAAGWLTLLRVKDETIFRRIILISNKDLVLSPSALGFIEFIQDEKEG